MSDFLQQRRIQHGFAVDVRRPVLNLSPDPPAPFRLIQNNSLLLQNFSVLLRRLHPEPFPVGKPESAALGAGLHGSHPKVQRLIIDQADQPAKGADEPYVGGFPPH